MRDRDRDGTLEASIMTAAAPYSRRQATIAPVSMASTLRRASNPGALIVKRGWQIVHFNTQERQNECISVWSFHLTKTLGIASK
jgi:hypothetical protein